MMLKEMKVVRAARSNPKRVNILLVDDRRDNLFSLEAALNELGENIVQANSGEQALRHVLNQDFAVILLDVQMPNMDGFETARLIREREKSRLTPIIFLTAFDKNDAQILRGYSTGAVDFLFKPVMPNILRAKVVTFVELYRKTQEVEAQTRQIELFNQKLEDRLLEVSRLNQELEASNNALIRSENLYRMLTRNLPQTSVFLFEQNLRYTLAEGPFLVECNIAVETINGKTVEEVLPPDLYSVWIAHHQAVFSGIQSAFEQYWRNNTYFVQMMPIKNEYGEIFAGIVMVQDITELRQTTYAFQRTYDLYATSRQISVANTPNGILNALLTSHYIQNIAQAAIMVFQKPWKDAPTNFEVVATLTGATLLGFAPDYRLSNSPLFQLFSLNQAFFLENVLIDSHLDPATKLLFDQHDIAQLMFFPLSTAGECFGLLVLYFSTDAYTNDDFNHIRIFADQAAIVMDNVRLMEAEQYARREAELANEIKLKFLAMISHELRTPLTSIKGFVSSLLATDVSWNAASQHEFLTIISEEADKLADLVNQVLDLSQLQVGTLHIRPVVHTFQSILDIAATQLTMLTIHHQLSIQLVPNLPPVMSDARRIAEVLTNLVGNAAKYAPEGTSIVIEAILQDEMVRVNVIDQGPGILLEDRGVVFEAFQQLNRQSPRPLKGAGLGLAICKGLIEAHHGLIWISDSDQPGTTISFTLPIAIPVVNVI